jgi:hypothetical protein
MIIFNQDSINNVAETQNMRASLNNVGITNQSKSYHFINNIIKCKKSNILSILNFVVFFLKVQSQMMRI